MRFTKFVWIGAAVLLASCATVAAIAQADPAQPPGGRRGGGGGFGQGRFGGQFGGGQQLTLASPQVPVDLLAKELKLSDEQKTAITAARTKQQADMRALMTPPADGGQINFQELRPKMTAINEQATKDIDAALKPEQKTEATALLKTLSSLQAVGIPFQTYSDLKLSDDQKKKLGEVGAEVQKDRAAKMREAQDAQQAGDNQKAQEIRVSLRGNGQPNEKGLAILSTEQKDLVTKYIKEHPPQAGRRPGGFGPGANPAPQP